MIGTDGLVLICWEHRLQCPAPWGRARRDGSSSPAGLGGRASCRHWLPGLDAEGCLEARSVARAAGSGFFWEQLSESSEDLWEAGVATAGGIAVVLLVTA